MSEKAALATKTPDNKGQVSLAAKPNEIQSRSLDSPVEQILQMQQSIGNQAVQKLFDTGTIQAKLKIGQPNDKYEQEADRVADQVMRMPDQKGSLVTGHSSLVQRQSTCPECPERKEIQTKSIAEQITPFVQRQVEPEIEEKEEEETVQPKSTGTQPQKVTPNIESRIQSLKGGGQPLSESTRSYFESLYGTDFSRVRVHTDSKAANASKSVNAKAFTTGQDVVFGAGQYSPGTSIGRGLLAHELIHVLQQEKSVNRILRRKNDQPNNKTDEKEQDDSLTLPEADTTGTKPEAEVDWLTELKNEVASRTKMPADAAWKCLEDVAKTIERIPETAWNWLKNLADRHDMEPLSVWDLIEDVVHQTKMRAVAAWNLIEDVAIQNFMPPVDAWNWLEYVVSRTVMAPDAAWNWIQDVAFQYSMPPVEAWDWIDDVSFGSGMPPSEAWGWLEYEVASTIDRTLDAAWKWLKEVGVKNKREPKEVWDRLNEVALKFEIAPKDLLILIDEEYIPNRLTSKPYKFNKDDLEARRRDWNLALHIMEITNEDELIKWLVGQKGLVKESKGKKTDYSQKVINAAIKESIIQMRGLMMGLKEAFENKIKLPTMSPEKKKKIESVIEEYGLPEIKQGEFESKIIAGSQPEKFGYRGAGSQAKIWKDKYEYESKKDWRKNFDRISQKTSNTCKRNLSSNYDDETLNKAFAVGKKWNPRNEERSKIHWECWSNVLTPEERQQEILEASSAPGISRHHWGTDVDILSFDPAKWADPKDGEEGGKYFKVYGWLKDNAWKYGFMQPYIPKESPESIGYMEERWHWSYYPVSSVLLEIARTKETELYGKLNEMWQKYGIDQFTYLSKEAEQGQYEKNWMYYVSNVMKEPWWEKEKGSGKKR